MGSRLVAGLIGGWSDSLKGAPGIPRFKRDRAGWPALSPAPRGPSPSGAKRGAPAPGASRRQGWEPWALAPGAFDLEDTRVTPQDISLAICGHAWHGKSTLLGKVVAESGMATQREVEEAHRLAGEGRDPSLVFAQLVFRSKDVSINQSEAARGVTILPSIVRFEFPEHRITVIDTPGQETYANNRFFGMFQADAAMVVVSCNDGVMPITEQPHER